MSDSHESDTCIKCSSLSDITSPHETSQSEFCIYCVLQELKATDANEDVREETVKKLYHIPIPDIDFVLPQLCQLAITCSPESHFTFYKFIADAASYSVHMALRAVWWCEASTKYVDDCNVDNAIQLTEMIETAIVNAPIMLTERDRITACRMRDYAVAEKSKSLASIVSVSNGASASQLPSTEKSTDKLTSSMMPEEKSSRDDEIKALLAELEHCSTRGNSEVQAVTPYKAPRSLRDLDASLILAPTVEDLRKSYRRQSIERTLAEKGYAFTTTSTVIGESSNPTIQVMERSIEYEELITFIAKQVRSEYFNSHIALVRFFNSISARLTRRPRGRERKIALTRYLAQCSSFGLYFPIFGLLDPHYRIVRIFNDEGAVLNSRDKAPFLLWAEVTWSNEVSTLDSNVFRAYDPVAARTIGKSLPPPLSFYFERSSVPQSLSIDFSSSSKGEVAELCSNSNPMELSPDCAVSKATGKQFGNEALSIERTSTEGPLPHIVTPRPNASVNERELAPVYEETNHPMTPISQNSQSGDLSESIVSTQPLLSPSPVSFTPSFSNVQDDSPYNPFGEHVDKKTLRLLRSVYAKKDQNLSSAHSLFGRRESLVVTAQGSVSEELAALSQDNPESKSDCITDYDQEKQVTRTRAASSALEDADREAVMLRVASGLGFDDDDVDDDVFLKSIPPGTSLLSVIFKGGDDCRQEVLAMQLIQIFDQVWSHAELPLKLRPYSVLVTSANSGIIETVPGTCSIDSLKKSVPDFISLAQFFETYFGPRATDGKFEEAQMNFVQSMAAYSLVSYFLQIKDRHNGNILLDNEGHIVHIDFGFMLSSSPGGNLNFESAPFKLTPELIEVMDGESSDLFQLFTSLFIRGFIEARRHASRILTMVEIMESANMTAFLAGGKNTVEILKSRFQLEMPDDECMEFAVSLVEESTNNWRSNQYDNYQKITNGIL